MTAYPDVEIAILAIQETGIENFFVKPFDAERVIDAVLASLYERRAREYRARSMAHAFSSMRHPPA